MVPILKLFNSDVFQQCDDITSLSAKQMCLRFAKCLADISKDSLVILIGFDLSIGWKSKVISVLKSANMTSGNEFKVTYSSPKCTKDYVLK